MSKIEAIKKWFKRNEADIFGLACISIGGAAALAGVYVHDKAYRKGFADGLDAADLEWALKLIDAHNNGLISTEDINKINPKRIQFKII